MSGKTSTEVAMIREVGETRVGVTVTVSEEGVNWTNRKDCLTETHRLKFNQILRSRFIPHRECSRVHVHHVKVVVDEERCVSLRHVTISFVASDDICSEVSNAIERRLHQTQNHRPRRLLVFINPIAGSQDSVKLFKTVVEPLFHKADISVRSIVTKYERHALEVLLEYDLSDIDAVVSMGGDGSNGHVFNGIMQKTMKDAGLDMDDESIDPVNPWVAFGVLPTGSGCGVAKATYNTVDLETAVLSIILGKTQKADTGVIRHRGEFVRYPLIGTLTGGLVNGFDLLESMRFLKKARYMLLLPAIWWEFRLYDVEIQYLPVPEDKREFRYALPANPSAENPACTTVDGPLPGWKTFRGKSPGFIFLSSLFARRISWAPALPYMTPNLSSGMYQLHIDKTRNAVGMINTSFLREFDRSNIPREKYEHIDVSEAKVKIFSDDPKLKSLSVDGEWHHMLDFSIKVSEKKYDLFVIDDELVSEALEYES